MTHAQRSLFISYRRQDSGAIAARIATILRSRIENSKVFLDETAIAGGADWLKTLQTEVESADIVLVLVGPQWLAAGDQAGRQRLRDPSDIVRREIEYALKMQRQIVPVLLSGAQMPAAADIPVTMSELAKIQAMQISEKQFERDVDAMVKHLISMLTRKEQELQEFIAMATGAKLAVSHGLSFSTFEYHGEWTIEAKPAHPIAIQRGIERWLIDGTTYKFVIADDAFGGTLEIHGHGLLGRDVRDRRNIQGKYSIAFRRDEQGEDIVTALVLEGVQDKGGPFVMSIPFDRRLGDAYSGVDASGNQFVSKLTSPRPKDTL